MGLPRIGKKGMFDIPLLLGITDWMQMHDNILMAGFPKWYTCTVGMFTFVKCSCELA